MNLTRALTLSLAASLLAASFAAFAGPGAIEGVEKQPVNVSAIAMFLVFVVATLGITKWAAGKTKSTADFYTAGGGITGFQNGLAIAGDYMSAATLLGPAGDGDAALAGVEADGDPAGMGAARLQDEMGIAQRHRPQNHPGDALAQPEVDAVAGADAATELQRDRHPAEDRLDRGGVHGAAGEGAVQVDDMQPSGAGGGERARLGAGIGIKDDGGGHVAPLQAHAVAALEIDGRKKDQGRHLRKLPIRRRPVAWLFSG